jgi:hypothetical protein
MAARVGIQDVNILLVRQPDVDGQKLRARDEVRGEMLLYFSGRTMFITSR